MELLDLNFSLGTIFTIYEDSIKASNIKISSYVTYGPTFQIVFASDNKGVQFFTYDGTLFIEQESFILNEKGNINSTAGDILHSDKKHKALIKNLFDNGYRLRFSNSLVLDTHQILFKRGGLYSSPATSIDLKGIVNLVFEAYPISYIIELANGKSTDGQYRILDIKLIDELTQKTAIYFGSKQEIDLVKDYFKKN